MASFFAIKSFTFFMETSAILKVDRSADIFAGSTNPSLFRGFESEGISSRRKITWQLTGVCGQFLLIKNCYFDHILE